MTRLHPTAIGPIMPTPLAFHSPQSAYDKGDLLQSAAGGYFGPGNAQLPARQC
jgi:3-hydroxyacyl-[acyl-carrier protein] dehydratase / trans-2-decenoyl-[acyl-carrier protein] isomerase